MARRKLYLPVMLAAAVAVACAVLVVLVVSEKAEATFPGKNGRIAYAGCNRANDYEIYTHSISEFMVMMNRLEVSEKGGWIMVNVVEGVLKPALSSNW
jgi:hypothetical protein